MLDAIAYVGHVNTNRFLLLDIRGREHEIHESALSDLAHELCMMGYIDDLLVLSTSLTADARYRIFGGDRREAEFCGNGALFAFSVLRREKGNGRFSLATNIGHCEGRLDDGQIKLRLGPVEEGRFQAKPWVMPYLREKYVGYLATKWAGEPHLVVSAPLYLKGSRFNQHRFEELCAPLRDGFKVDGGVNVTMTFSTDYSSTAMIRTFERGACRMTGSCGSGALAAASALFSGMSGDGRVMISSPGGAHQVWYEPERAAWWLSAQAIHERCQPLGTLLDSLHEKVS